MRIYIQSGKSGTWHLLWWNSNIICFGSILVSCFLFLDCGWSIPWLTYNHSKGYVDTKERATCFGRNDCKLSLKRKNKKETKPEKKASTSLKEHIIQESPFKGMKEFHLSSSTCNLKRTRGNHIINGDNRTRTAALRKLSKKLNIELETNSIVRTPVRLVGEV